MQNRREILKLQSTIKEVKISYRYTRNRELGEELLNFLVYVANQMCSQLFFFPYFSGTVSSLTKYNTRGKDMKDNDVFPNTLRGYAVAESRKVAGSIPDGVFANFSLT